MPETLFDRAFVINLKERPSRLTSFFDGYPNPDWIPEIEVIEAVNGNECPPPDNWHCGGGAWGCYRSHMVILEYCMRNRVGSYIVFEDDAHFRPDFVEKGAMFARALPDNWQQAYLGGQLLHAHTHPPRRINPEVIRPYNVNRTHCFALSRTGMESVYRHCMRLPFEKHFHIDHHLGRWHEDARNFVYCPNEWLVGQHGFKSDISGREEGVQFYDNPETQCLSRNKSWFPFCIVYRANPGFIPEARAFLHFGNSVGIGGIDPELQRASELKNPYRVLNYWYGFVSNEARTSDRVPAMYHPEIETSLLQEALPEVEFIEISQVSSVEDLEAQVLKIRDRK